MYGRPVAGLVAERARNTAAARGRGAARRDALRRAARRRLGQPARGSLPAAIRAASVVGLSLPSLVSSLLLVLVAARTGWLPTGGMTSPDAAGARGWLAAAADLARHLVVPALRARAAAGGHDRAAAVAGHRPRRCGSRSSPRPPRAGVPPRPHPVAPRAEARRCGPVAAVFGLIFGSLLSGSFVVEIVTSWPGLGRLMFDALRSRDLYLVAGCAAAGGVFLAPGALLSDVALAAVDPRLRGRRGGAQVRRAGLALVACVALVGRGSRRRSRRTRRTTGSPTAPYAPPMPIRVVDAGRAVARAVCLSRPPRRPARAALRGGPGAPRAARVVLARRRGRRQGDGQRRPVAAARRRQLGRDVFARLVYGARLSLAVALAGHARRAAHRHARRRRGRRRRAALADEALMRLSDFVLVLPAMYVVLALRAALPLVLPAAPGVRARRGHPRAGRLADRRARRARHCRRRARARLRAGRASPSAPGRARLLVRHLLPAARGFLATQATLLVAAFILAEATLSYVGLGFPDPR